MLSITQEGKPVTMTKETEKLLLAAIKQQIRRSAEVTKFIVIQETFIQTILKPFVRAGAVIGILAINHYKFDDSVLGAVLLGIAFAITYFFDERKPAYRANGKRELQQLLEHLNNQ